MPGWIGEYILRLGRPVSIMCVHAFVPVRTSEVAPAVLPRIPRALILPTHKPILTTKYARLCVVCLPRYKGRRGAPFEGAPAWKRGRTAVISRPSASSYRTSTCLPSVHHPRCPPRLLSLTKRGLHYQAKQKGRELRQNEEERRPLRSSQTPPRHGTAAGRRPWSPPGRSSSTPAPSTRDVAVALCALAAAQPACRSLVSRRRRCRRVAGVLPPPAMSRQRRWLVLGALPPPVPGRGT